MNRTPYTGEKQDARPFDTTVLMGVRRVLEGHVGTGRFQHDFAHDAPGSTVSPVRPELAQGAKNATGAKPDGLAAMVAVQGGRA